MKLANIKNSVLAASAIAAACGAGVASAHTVSGTLGTAATATDLYYVTCSDDGNGATGKLQVGVRDNAPVAAPLVSITAIQGSKAGSTTDTTDGNATGSAPVTVAGITGVFYVAVTKSTAGAESYTVDFHCLTATNAHTGTAASLKQNQ